MISSHFTGNLVKLGEFFKENYENMLNYFVRNLEFG